MPRERHSPVNPGNAHIAYRKFSKYRKIERPLVGLRADAQYVTAQANRSNK